MDLVQYVYSHLEKATAQEMLEILWNTPVDELGDVLLYAVEKSLAIMEMIYIIIWKGWSI